MPDAPPRRKQLVANCGVSETTLCCAERLHTNQEATAAVRQSAEDVILAFFDAHLVQEPPPAA